MVFWADKMATIAVSVHWERTPPNNIGEGEIFVRARKFAAAIGIVAENVILETVCLQ